jgi:hypothetical protein
MTVGSFAGIAFYVTDDTVRTLNSLSLESSAHYAVHERHGRVDLPEFTGVELQKASFDMLLLSYLGADPMSLYETLRGVVNSGQSSSLILGAKRIGTQWTATNVKLESQQFDGAGNVTVAKVSVSLQEYPAA